MRKSRKVRGGRSRRSRRSRHSKRGGGIRTIWLGNFGSSAPLGATGYGTSAQFGGKKRKTKRARKQKSHNARISYHR
jgi:hypothetical protein